LSFWNTTIATADPSLRSSVVRGCSVGSNHLEPIVSGSRKIIHNVYGVINAIKQPRTEHPPEEQHIVPMSTKKIGEGETVKWFVLIKTLIVSTNG